MSSPQLPEEPRRPRFGFGARVLLVCLLIVGAWVVVGSVLSLAHSWLRYLTVGAVCFAAGAMYGRFRRYEHDERRKSSH
jgi:hypothetical protein